MKIVINGDYGGFGYGVAAQYRDFVQKHEWMDYEEGRTAPDLIDFVENHPDECGDLCIATIPDNSTDWEIDEYDGSESIIYVVDGKIYRTNGDE